MRARQIEVQIDELVLRGFDGLDRDAVTASLEAELSRLLETGPATDWQRLASNANLVNAPRIELPANARASEVGAALARSLHALLGGRPKGAR